MGRIFAGALAFLLKIGAKILPIVLKFAKFGKFGLAIGTVAIYSYLFTWQFALVLMGSLFFHENGHIWAMKRCGLKTKGIYFIPFVGAMAVTSGEFKSRRDEVFIAIMGPIWGFILAVITAGVYFVTKNPFYGAVAGWMALLNLFNLLPVNPLDGGRIMKSIAFSINSKIGIVFLAMGLIITVILTFWLGIILFTALTILGVMELLYEYEREERIPRLKTTGLITSVIMYIVIVVVLFGLMTYMNYIPEVEMARKVFMS